MEPITQAGFIANARLPSGFTAGYVVRRAAAWWDKTGRHVVRSPEFQDQDMGVASDIMRGLRWAECNAEARCNIVAAWRAEFEQKLADLAGSGLTLRGADE
jgi:hypothetical protein